MDLIGSSSHVTTDSGCVLSFGTDTLLNTLDKLDITPRRKNRSLSHRKSSIFCRSKLLDISVDSFSKEENLSQKLVEPPRDLIRHLNTNTKIESSDFSSSSSSSNLNESKISLNYQKLHKENRKGNSALRIHSQTFQNGVSSHSCETSCSDILKLSESISKTPKHQIRESPLVSQLVKQATSNIERMSYPLTKEESLDLKLNRSVTQGITINQRKESVSVDREKSDKKMSNNDSFLSTSSNSFEPKSEIRKNFYSCLSSLESWLVEEKEDTEIDKYQFKVNSNDIPKLINVKKNLSEDLAPFQDSKSFFEKKEELSTIFRKGSVFQTITESAVSGEIDPSFLLDDSLDKEVRRESLNISRRDSILQMSRRESTGAPTISTLAGRLSIEGETIFDQSDSCLLSISSDTF